jgi:regulation of enolase protein 1 (concanavalin A-like superfamily)
MLGLVLTNAAKAADPNLVGWWKLDDTGFIATDSSGMGNTGTLFGGPQWVTGQVGGALDFDGTDDYVDLPIGTLISTLRSSTLSIWANFSGAGGDWQRLWDLGTGTTNYMFLTPRVGATGVFRFAILVPGGAGESMLDGPTTLPSDWHNVTVVINGVSRNMQLCLDGDVVASGPTQTLPADLGVTNQNWLGRSQWGADAYYSGSLDDFRIYNRPLTIDEVDMLVPRFIVKSPQPADGAVVTTTTVTLSWTAGHTADSHHVYIGENLDDVTNGTGGTDKGLTKSTSYVAANLETGKTYYWRVDEVEANGVTVHTGPVWSFTVSPKMASNPVPPNGTRFVVTNATLTWTAGAGSTQHHIYIGNNLQDVQAGTGGTDKGTVETAAFVPDSLETGKTYYWRVDEFDGTATYTGEVWYFRTLSAITITDPNLVGWWKLDEGEGTTALDWSGHGYNGTILGGCEWIEGYDGGALKFDGQNDYVDLPIGSLLSSLKNSTFAIWANFSNAGGNWPRIWDFGTGATTANMFLTPCMGAAGAMRFAITIGGNAAGAEDQTTAPDTLAAGWHHVTVTFDPAKTTHLLYLDGSVLVTNTNARYTPSNLGVTTQNWLGRSQYTADSYYPGSLDDFRIYNYTMTPEQISTIMKGDPLPARYPKPANKTVTDVEKALPFIWSVGEKAAQHDVYLGTNALAVEGAGTSDTTGIYRGRQDPNSFNPADGIKAGQTYYWRIDEVNTDGTISVGRVWSFTVANYIIVDDFEQYNNTDNQIYNTWSDYYVNNTGMTVGYFDPPFAEQSIVQGGAQAMYVRYDNDGTVNEGTNFEKSGTLLYSEAERTWADAQDWTRKGVTSLTLWFRGITGSIGSFTLGPPIKMTGLGTDIAGTADQCYFAYKKLSGNGVIIAKVLSITNTDSLAKAGVMMRESLDAGSKHFTVVASPSSRVSFVRRTTTGGAAVSTPKSGVNIPVWVRLTRNGNTFTTQYSANGTTWITVGTPQEIQMPAELYVGLCVTSRNATTICTAEFSDVTNPGTGDWKSQDIGLAVNSPEQLYVALQDSAGQSAVVKHSNPAATTITTYTEWNIPLTGFNGVNLQAITKMSIGVGDRANTQPGGSGVFYIDDIGLRLP